MSIDDKIREEIPGQPPARRFGQGLPPGTMSGIVLIAVGTLFLLDHLGFIHIGDFWKFWPLILIASGLVKLVSEANRVSGPILILIGVYFQLSNFGLINISWGTFWPALLILGGILMIFTRFDWANRRTLSGGTAGAGTAAGLEVLNEFALFAGVERRVTVANFRGGRVEAIFGGVEIDFRSADMEGAEAIVDVEALFGGIEMILPERWTVIFQGQSIFGGYSDETRQSLPDVMGSAPKKTLILRGRALFGGISVKN